MKSTAKALSDLTDAGQFEGLGSAFLREMYPHLRVLIDTGRNEKGETTKGKIDGFTEYANDKFALVQYTINDSNLEYKWFSNNEKKLGDLPKTLREIEALRATRPNATFEIYLVTHHVIDAALATKVASFASQDFLSIFVIDNSAISHFLNTTGQYLRSQYLGIRQDLISKELLSDIAAKNLETFRSESSIDQSLLASLEERQRLMLHIYNESNTFCLLVGESGVGKSTALYTCMTTLSAEGVLCLRIRPEIVLHTHSLAGALIQQLEADYPSLYVSETLLSQLIDKKVLIIVDDVNRCPNPRSVIMQLRFWSRTSALFPFKVVCPVWPKHWEMDPSDKEASDTVRTIPAANTRDAARVLEKYADTLHLQLSEQLKRMIVLDLGGDLLLIGLYCNGLYTPESIRSNLGKGISLLQQFVDASINAVSARHMIPAYRLTKSLASFGRMMLVQRTPGPHYDDIQRWFPADSDVIHHLQLLQADQSLFHFDPDGNIIYRHDRFRDVVLARGFQLLLQDTCNSPEIIADPYFAEIAAIAVATGSFTQTECDALVSVNPLGLFNALKFVQDPPNNAKYSLLLHSLQHWQQTQATSFWLIPEVRQIGLSLLQFDVPKIYDVLKNIPVTIEIALAKFRSGDLLGALQYFTFGETTAPYSREAWRDQVISHVNLNYRNQLISTIQSIVHETFNPQLRTSLFRLCGFLQSDKLVNLQYLIWKPTPNKDEYGDYLWGILQSANEAHRAIVEDALAFFATLSDVPEDPRYQSRNEQSEFLMTFSIIQWTLTREQIQLLADVGRSDTAFARLIALIFDGLDSPIAVTFVVHYLCNPSGHHQKAEDTRAPITIGWKLNDRSRRISLSAPALMALEEIWADKMNPAPKRKLAFDFWEKWAPKENVLSRCRKIPPDDAALLERSIRTRVGLGDVLAAEAIKADIATNKYFWKLEMIWNQDIQSFVLELLSRDEFCRNRHFMEGFWDLLLKIPDPDGTYILSSQWEKLKRFWQAIPTALFIATSGTRKLAAKQINELGFSNWSKLKAHYLRMMHGTVVYVNNTDPLNPTERADLTFLSESFGYLHHIYGNVDKGQLSRLTLERLDSLLPYRELLHDLSVGELANTCIRKGWQDWLILHLYPVMDKDQQKHFFPSDEDLSEKLKHITTGNILGQAYSFNEHRNRLGISTDRIMTVLFNFSQSTTSYAGLQVLCYLLQFFGDRSHFRLIENYQVTDDIPVKEVSQLKIDTQYEMRRRSLR